MGTPIQELFEQARRDYRQARGSYDESLEALGRIQELAEQALNNPTYARDLLRRIVATAENAMTGHENANSALSAARVSIEKAHGSLK